MKILSRVIKVWKQFCFFVKYTEVERRAKDRQGMFEKGREQGNKALECKDLIWNLLSQLVEMPYFGQISEPICGLETKRLGLYTVANDLKYAKKLCSIAL